MTFSLKDITTLLFNKFIILSHFFSFFLFCSILFCPAFSLSIYLCFTKYPSHQFFPLFISKILLKNFWNLLNRDYMKQADPSHSSTKFDTKISRKQFFDLCTSRQLSVRRLLEAFGSSTVCTDSIIRVCVYVCVCMCVWMCVCQCISFRGYPKYAKRQEKELSYKPHIFPFICIRILSLNQALLTDESATNPHIIFYIETFFHLLSSVFYLFLYWF